MVIVKVWVTGCVVAAGVAGCGPVEGVLGDYEEKTNLDQAPISVRDVIAREAGGEEVKCFEREVEEDGTIVWEAKLRSGREIEVEER